MQPIQMQKLSSNPRKRGHGNWPRQCQSLVSPGKFDNWQLVLLVTKDDLDEGLSFVIEYLDGIGIDGFGGESRGGWWTIRG